MKLIAAQNALILSGMHQVSRFRKTLCKKRHSNHFMFTFSSNLFFIYTEMNVLFFSRNLLDLVLGSMALKNKAPKINPLPPEKYFVSHIKIFWPSCTMYIQSYFFFFLRMHEAECKMVVHVQKIPFKKIIVWKIFL